MCLLRIHLLTQYCVLILGKGGNEMTRILLTPEESDLVMPKLEEMFLKYQDTQNM